MRSRRARRHGPAVAAGVGPVPGPVMVNAVIRCAGTGCCRGPARGGATHAASRALGRSASAGRDHAVATTFTGLAAAGLTRFAAVTRLTVQLDDARGDTRDAFARGTGPDQPRQQQPSILGSVDLLRGASRSARLHHAVQSEDSGRPL